MNDINTLLDRQDVRVRHDKGVSGAIRTFIDRVKSGDLGSLPVIVGLLIIWTVFQTLNPVFLSSNNLVNLLFDCSTIGVISLGIVCVLMLGEIDLSVGSISGLSSAIIGVLWVNNGWPVGVAIIAALCAGALAGFLYALLYNRFSMPSFVSTLAGLLAALGLQLYLLGNTGSINLPYGSWLVSFGQLLVMPRPLSYALALVAGLAIFFTGFRAAQHRRTAGLSAPSAAGIALKALVITLIIGCGVFYLNQSRGVPWMFALFVALVIAMNYALTRTRWGRCVQAVGGNREAARRAGINVNFIYVSAFMACSTLAAAGGIMAAARLASSSQQAGTGDVNLNAIAAAVIGGTSLFGGRGSAWSALLGIIVIQSIASGLTLLDLSSSLRYMITGAVLAIAVIVDSLARRSRQSHGRA
ncbi:simple sugar transport system permease [Brucella sp. NVSL 07-0026]|uniref:sugar ABC transporter permease n=1 Tax=Brucella sp. NVSL 07-0026 TaxID=520448 RepID=UPI0001D0CA48|nr:sugar ABC transporter permease [Brucella sp. NVSL 07-0026]EFG35935.1 simple sugar transport system permease [Brucella sp. NVSL 07-0026]